MSPVTARNHVSSLLTKLGLEYRTQAAAWAAGARREWEGLGQLTKSWATTVRGSDALRGTARTLSRVKIPGRAVASVLKENPRHGKTTIDPG